MDYETFVQHVRADGDRLAAVARGRLPATVPSCPGWSMRDLVGHVAEVYEHKIACTELGRAPEPWPPTWPEDREPVRWLGDAHARLVAMFGEHRPSDPSATWWPSDQTVGFWARRMAHETAVHRIDAELAVGDVTPIDDELALDGIDEVLTIMLAGDWSEEPSEASVGQKVAIGSSTRAWIVTLERSTIEVAEGGGDAEATIGGEPSDVLLWLWGRAADPRVSRSGPEETIRLLRSRLAQATQ
jgi:uncharacterized protein (TIGR03083 family)